MEDSSHIIIRVIYEKVSSLIALVDILSYLQFKPLEITKILKKSYPSSQYLKVIESGT